LFLYNESYISKRLAVKKKHLEILFIIALMIGLLGIVLSAFFASFAFIIFSFPNLSLAAFFGFKYYTYDKRMREQQERRQKTKRKRNY